MKSDVIQIYGDLTGSEKTIQAAEKFIQYNNFTGKNAMHIRLLTEELVSMVHGIMDHFKGDLWFESEPDEEGVLCRICLSTFKSVNEQQEEQFLSVASSGKNENAKGILGKIREAFRVSTMYSTGGSYMNEYAAANYWYNLGAYSGDLTASAMGTQYWSLQNYRSNLPSEQSAGEAWDELEKSIVAKLADDVKVWLKTDTTEVVIEKKIKQ